MGVSVEPCTFMIRGGSKHQNFGDVYDYVITGFRISDTAVRLVGLVRKDGKNKLSTDDYREIKKYFKSIGITEIDRDRKNRDQA